MNSLCFSGVAKLTSDFDERAHFKFWLNENKWFGLFRIEWVIIYFLTLIFFLIKVYIKDIEFTHFEALK
jgi:hypothetical protein